MSKEELKGKILKIVDEINIDSDLMSNIKNEIKDTAKNKE